MTSQFINPNNKFNLPLNAVLNLGSKVQIKYFFS